MTNNVDLVRGGYAAFGRGDVPAVLQIFDPAVEWYAPVELPTGGIFRGPDAVAGFFSRLAQHYQQLQVVPTAFHDAGDTVVVEGRHHGMIGDARFDDVGFAHVWTLVDGRVTRFREYMDSGKLLPLLAPTAAPAAT